MIMNPTTLQYATVIEKKSAPTFHVFFVSSSIKKQYLWDKRYTIIVYSPN